MDFPKTIWTTLAGAISSAIPDPDEAEDKQYILTSEYDLVVEERNSWRGIATRLMNERHYDDI